MPSHNTHSAKTHFSLLVDAFSQQGNNHPCQGWCASRDAESTDNARSSIRPLTKAKLHV